MSKKVWVVLREGSHGGPFDSFGSRESADKKASTQALKNPGVTYVVFESVGFCRLPVEDIPTIKVKDMEAGP
jgi:hypothetical protein